MTPPPSTEQTLCARLRAARKERGLSLTELASRIGCSVGYLSQIERGLSSPSLRIMVSLSEVFGVNLSTLFSGGTGAGSDTHGMIMRRDQRSRLDLHGTGIAKEALTSHHDDRMLNLYQMVIAPGGVSGAEPLVHSGEECGVLLAGRMILELDGVRWELQEGDSFRFPSTLPHRYYNPAEIGDARILWVTTTVKRTPEAPAQTT